MADLVINITQGASYRNFSVLIPGNYSTWIPSGQIRRTAADDEVLAVWDFLPATYNSGTDRTTFYPYLGATKTAAIPVPPAAGRDGTRPGVNVWQTDIEIRNPNDSEQVIKLLQITPVAVTPEVTR